MTMNNPFLRDGGGGSWRAKEPGMPPHKLGFASVSLDQWIALVGVALREGSSFGPTFYEKLMNRPCPFPRRFAMTEQEYEKSIAGTIWIPEVYLYASPTKVRALADLKAEREFSRGVWATMKHMRQEIADARAALGGGFTAFVITPIPDAPKPDPRKTDAFMAAETGLCAAGKLTKDVADEIIREVRARTVK